MPSTDPSELHLMNATSAVNFLMSLGNDKISADDIGIDTSGHLFRLPRARGKKLRKDHTKAFVQAMMDNDTGGIMVEQAKVRLMRRRLAVMISTRTFPILFASSAAGAKLASNLENLRLTTTWSSEGRALPSLILNRIEAQSWRFIREHGRRVQALQVAGRMDPARLSPDFWETVKGHLGNLEGGDPGENRPEEIEEMYRGDKYAAVTDVIRAKLAQYRGVIARVAAVRKAVAKYKKAVAAASA